MISRERLHSLAVFVLAVVVHSWTATLPFQLDDYALLPGIGTELGIDDGAAKDRAQEMLALAEAGDAPPRYLYRPVAWLFWWTLMQLNGSFADPFWFHVGFLLIHGCVAVLLHRILLRLCSPRGALLGAVCAAILPGGIQAVSWTAATGDLLATAWMAAATLCLMQRGWVRTTSAGLFVAAAFLSKESAIMLLPAMTLAVGAGRRDETAWRRWSWIPWTTGMLVVAWAWRANALDGNWALSYAYDATSNRGFAFIVTKAAHLATSVLQGLVPWNQDPALADAGWVPALSESVVDAAVAALRAGVVALLGAATLSGIVTAGTVRPRVFFAGLVVLGIAFAPAALLFNDHGTNGISRLLYPGFAVFAVLLGIAWDRVHVGWVLVFFVFELLFVAHVAATEHRAADRIRSRVESLSALLDAHPRTNWLVFDGQAGVGEIPLIYCNTNGAFHAPISRRDRTVVWWGDRSTIDRIPHFWDRPEAIRFASVVGDRYVDDGALIPTVVERLPRLAWSRPGVRADFATPLSSRSLNGVAFDLDASGSTTAATVTWHMEDGDREVALGVVDPKLGRLTVFTPDDFAWIRSGWVRGITISGPKLAGDPEPLHLVAQVGLLSPKEHARIAPTTPPVVEFRPVRPMEHYRVTFDFVIASGVHLPVVYDVPAARFEAFGDGFLRFVPRAGDAVSWPSHTFQVAWDTLPAVFDRELVARGVYRVKVGVRVEGVGGVGGAAAWRSRWRHFVVETKPR